MLRRARRYDLLLHGRAYGGDEAIAPSRDRQDVAVAFEAVAERTAQGGDMHRQIVVHDMGVRPYPRHDLLLLDEIAGTLEQRWNDAMQRLLELEAELANFERQTLRTITADQKRQILQLASDFPRLWTAQTTAARDRKRMLRLLIRDITVTKGQEPKLLRLNIRWQGGAIETIELRLPPNRAEELRYPDAFVAHIRALAATLDDA